MTTRLATPDDTRGLLEMMREFNAIEMIAWDERIERGLRALFADASKGRVIVGEADGAIFGYVVVTWGFDLEFGGPDAFITEVYVRADRRGRGLGRELVQAAERIAREGGAGAVHLMVRPENAPALALYRRAGFEAVPRLLMTKKI
jgi:ribosomal protein S18 acetylase RimI-like enzyme